MAADYAVDEYIDCSADLHHQAAQKFSIELIFNWFIQRVFIEFVENAATTVILSSNF